MTPHKVIFYVYAESEYEVKRLQDALYNFVDTLYKEGVYVTAERLTELTAKAYSAPLVKTLLK